MSDTTPELDAVHELRPLQPICPICHVGYMQPEHNLEGWRGFFRGCTSRRIRVAAANLRLFKDERRSAPRAPEVDP